MKPQNLQREQFILTKLAKEGQVTVEELAKELSLSQVTIRSELRELEQRGLLTRYRGGARPSSIQNVLTRASKAEKEKEAIARFAAQMVKDYDRIMIEAGTTTALVPKYLREQVGVQIVTNSTLVFQQARTNPKLEVVMTGGTFHRPTESLVGGPAIETIRQFNVRLALVGTDGFSVKRGLTTQFAEGAEIVRAMHKQAENTWLLTDATKLGQAGFVCVLPIEDVHGLITDQAIGSQRQEFAEHGLEVHVV